MCIITVPLIFTSEMLVYTVYARLNIYSRLFLEFYIPTKLTLGGEMKTTFINQVPEFFLTFICIHIHLSLSFCAFILLEHPLHAVSLQVR